MMYKDSDLLEKLSYVRWSTVYRTYGNNHNGLIGLLMDWWVQLAPEKNTILTEKGKNGIGRIDAIFVRDESAIGILEVEGSKHEYCLEKIEKYFQLTDRRLINDQQYLQNFQSLRFAILVAYDNINKGVPPFDSIIMPKAKRVSEICHDKNIIIITIEKEYEKINTGVRSWSPWFKGTVKRIYGCTAVNGEIKYKKNF